MHLLCIFIQQVILDLFGYRRTLFVSIDIRVSQRIKIAKAAFLIDDKGTLTSIFVIVRDFA